MSHEQAIARNVRLYPLYTAAGRFHCNAAVFYLYFAELLSLERLLQLEAVYYVAYVLLEVPSGYVSDRVGRRPTLLVSALAFVLAFLLFSLGSGFAVFALAQVAMAVGWTFRSGSDTSMHYDSLASLGREAEYGAREAVAERNAFAAAAVAAVVGGALGTWELRAAYVASLLASVVPVALVWRMTEPAIHAGAPAGPPRFLAQLALCGRVMWQTPLTWLAGLSVALYVLAHVPYMFYQPYISALLDGREGTALVTGLHGAAAMLLGALGGALSIRLRDRVGVRGALLGGYAGQLLLIALMSLTLHPAVAALVLLRSLQPALTDVILRAEIAPRVARAQRATYLSVQSLLGRLAFSATLLALAGASGVREAMDPAGIQTLLGLCALLGAAALVALIALRPRLARSAKG